jgi:hypothetical protein
MDTFVDVRWLEERLDDPAIAIVGALTEQLALRVSRTR